jgi:F-type H+-transporting ATPase subunit epsilon
MRLKVLVPTEVFLNLEVTKVIAEARNGSFCILPRHIDFVASLVAGILSFETGEGEEFIAVNEGILVKCGEDVFVSTRGAVREENLGELKDKVKKQFWVLDERQRAARSAMARLEANFVRRFVEIGERT